MSTFNEAIGPLLENEGGRLVAQDNGRGPSKWGVTLQSYREMFPGATADDIRDLGREQAAAFYRQMFWERHRIALIDDQAVANKMLDLAVNIGPFAAAKIAQRAVGAAPADGILGPKTAAAINSRPAALVLQGIRTAGAQYYRELVDRRPEYARFLDGWLARLAK